MPLFVFMGVMLEKSRLAEDLMDVIGACRRRPARRPGHRHHPGRRADGRDHRHRRRDRRDARAAHAADAAAARLRQGRSPAASSAPPARSGRSSRRASILILLADIIERVGRHAVRRRDDPGPDAGRHLLHLLLVPRHVAPRNGAACSAGGARPAVAPRTCGQASAAWCCRRSRWSARCSARSSAASRRRPKPPPWARSARSWSPRSAAACPGRCCATRPNATTRITAMMMFILICAQVFSLAFRGLQGERLVQDFFALLPGGINGCHLVPDVASSSSSASSSSGSRSPTSRCRCSCRSSSRPGRHGVARDADLREPADLVPHAAVWLGAVFPARRRAARGHDRRHLSRHHSVRRDAAHCAGAVLLLSQLRTWLPKTIGW